MACCVRCERVDPYLGAAMCADRQAMGDLLPTIVWPSDVEAYKRKLAPDFEATHATVQGCSGLDAGARVAWDDFYRAWKGFEAEPAPLFGSANKYDEAKAYEARLASWQEVLSRKCSLSAPIVVAPKGFDVSAVKWVAAAAIVAAVAYGAHKLL